MQASTPFSRLLAMSSKNGLERPETFGVHNARGPCFQDELSCTVLRSSFATHPKEQRLGMFLMFSNESLSHDGQRSKTFEQFFLTGQQCPSNVLENTSIAISGHFRFLKPFLHEVCAVHGDSDFLEQYFLASSTQHEFRRVGFAF